MTNSLRYRLAAPFAFLAMAACITPPPPDAPRVITPPPAIAWQGCGYLIMGGPCTSLGVYETEARCQAAVSGWMSRQVVGNAIDGACLPVRR